MILFFYPLFGAAIGWLVMLIVEHYVFKPHKIKYFLGIPVQGILPKYRHTFTHQLEKYDTNQLFQFIGLDSNKIEELLQIIPSLEDKIDFFLREKVKEKIPALAMFIGEKTISMIKESLVEEIQLILPKIITKYTSSEEDKLNIPSIISKQINNLTDDQVENIVKSKFGKLIRYSYIIGILCGVLIGTFFMILTLFTLK